MSETVSETRACDLLSRVFRARGYSISRNVMFHEYGVEFHVDGWDAAARVGFEFLSSEDDDHDDLTLREYKTLMDAQQRGELSLFIIDEVEPLSAADLTATVHEFLDEVVDAARARQKVTAGRAKRSKGRSAAAPRKPTLKKQGSRAGAVGKKPARRPRTGGKKAGPKTAKSRKKGR